MFRGDPAHLGVYPVSGVPRLGGIAWRTVTDGTVRSSPAVTRDRVYVGSSDGKLYALDRSTGAVRWKHDAGGSVLSSPAVARGLVLFAKRNGTLVALDAAKGATRWSVSTGPARPFPWGREGWDFYVSSPVITGDLAIFAAADGNVYALEVATGRERWRYSAGTLFRSSAAVAEGSVVVGGADGYVYALNLADGKLRWRGETEGATLDSEKEGFDRKTIQGSPTVAGGKVYVGSRDAYLYAFDLATGKQLWRAGKPAPWVVTSPVVWGGRIYFGSSDGHYVTAVDPDSGKRVWLVRTPDNVIASPVLADSILYVADMSGNLFALDAATGAEHWRTSLGTCVLSTPVPTDGGLYVGGDDGAVYAIRATELVQPVAVDPKRPTALLGIPHAKLGFTYYQALPTRQGDAWGLKGRAMSFWTLDPKLVPGGVLALDEFEQAGAWVRSYGGPPGTGFVYLWGLEVLPELLPQVRAAADFGIWTPAR